MHLKFILNSNMRKSLNSLLAHLILSYYFHTSICLQYTSSIVSGVNLNPSILLSDSTYYYFKQNNTWYSMDQQSNLPIQIDTSFINNADFWIAPGNNQLVSAFISGENIVTVSTISLPNITSNQSFTVMGMYDGYIQVLYYSQYVMLFGEYILVVDLNSFDTVCNLTISLNPPAASFIFSNDVLTLNKNGTFFYSCSSTLQNNYTTQQLNVSGLIALNVASTLTRLILAQIPLNNSLSVYIVDENLNAENQNFSISNQDLAPFNISAVGQETNEFMVFWGNNSFNSLCSYSVESLSPFSISTIQCLDFYLPSNFVPVVGASNVLISNTFGSIILQASNFQIINTFNILPPIIFPNGLSITAMSFLQSDSSLGQYFQLCTNIICDPSQQITVIQNSPFIYSQISLNLLNAVYIPPSGPFIPYAIPLPAYISQIMGIQLNTANTSQLYIAIKTSDNILIINAQGQVEATLPLCSLIFLGTQYVYCLYQNTTLLAYTWTGDISSSSTSACSAGTLAKVNESTLACISLDQQSIQIYNVETQELVWSTIIPMTALFLSQTYVTHAWYPLNFNYNNSQLSGYMVILPETIYVFSTDGTSFNLTNTNFFVLPNGSLFFPNLSPGGLVYNSSVINVMEWNAGTTVSLYTPPDNYGWLVILITILLLGLTYGIERLKKNREQKVLNFKETLFELQRKS